MVKKAISYVISEEARLIYGSTAMYDVNRSRNSYIIYNQGKLEMFDEDEKMEMDILSLLDSLGYPMDEIGTYFYKNVIFNVVNILRKKQNGEVEVKSDLINQLNSRYSQFWLDVSRNDLDIGIKTFQDYISKAIAKIDYSKTDGSLLSQVNDNFSCDMNYGNVAYILALKIMKDREVRNDRAELKRSLSI